MSGRPPDWGLTSRFFLPNEDAAVVRAAVDFLDAPVRRPVFVGGSGMVLLEVAGALPALERATFVDITSFQLEYFREVIHAVTLAGSPDGLRRWFIQSVYPRLAVHFRGRGREYPLDRVMEALSDRFGVTFFFDTDALDRAREAAGKVDIVRDDIVAYLARRADAHDFIYLSNVPDYLFPAEARRLFAACRARRAPVYLLVTDACPDPEGLRRIWSEAGYAPHPDSERLNRENRGLGASSLRVEWNRPGAIFLLLPAP